MRATEMDKAQTEKINTDFEILQGNIFARRLTRVVLAMHIATGTTNANENDKRGHCAYAGGSA
jgi:hypothetical protein